jgi:hypothetical protein
MIAPDFHLCMHFNEDLEEIPCSVPLKNTDRKVTPILTENVKALSA